MRNIHRHRPRCSTIKKVIDFWLHFIGVEKTHSIVIENTWSDREAETLAKGKSEAIRLVEQL
jgi:hypothetical protein